jgi:DNA-directed RNA polymerase subunit RPC12/RpoP
MHICPECGGETRRSHRSFWEQFFYRAAYRCRSCDERILVRKRVPLPSRYTNCPRCAGRELSILKKPDHIERLNTNPLRLVQRFFGARLYYCWACRLQYYDLRGRQPAMRQTAGDRRQ